MWSTLHGDNLKETKELRDRAATLFFEADDGQVLLFILNNFLHFHGTLANDSQVSLHNAAEEIVTWLMGPRETETGNPDPLIMDPRYLEQLKAAIDSVPRDRVDLLKKEGWQDAPRRRRGRKPSAD